MPYVHPVLSLPYKLLASLPRVEKGMRLTEPAAVSYIFNIPDRPVGVHFFGTSKTRSGWRGIHYCFYLTCVDYDGLDKGLDSGLEYRTYFSLGYKLIVLFPMSCIKYSQLSISIGYSALSHGEHRRFTTRCHPLLRGRERLALALDVTLLYSLPQAQSPNLYNPKILVRIYNLLV